MSRSARSSAKQLHKYRCVGCGIIVWPDLPGSYTPQSEAKGKLFHSEECDQEHR